MSNRFEAQPVAGLGAVFRGGQPLAILLRSSAHDAAKGFIKRGTGVEDCHRLDTHQSNRQSVDIPDILNLVPEDPSVLNREPGASHVERVAFPPTTLKHRIS